MYVCFILYLKNKVFIKSYLPLLLWIYTLLFIGELIIGRSGHGIGELQASRYIGDSIFAIIADIYVVALVYSSNNGKTLKFFFFMDFLLQFYLVFSLLMLDNLKLVEIEKPGVVI